MKSNFFHLITISLATSVLLAPTPKAFGQSVESQINRTEPQSLVFDVDSISNLGNSGIQVQGQIESSTATTNNFQATQSNQPSSVQLTTPANNPLAGCFITFVFIVYIVAGIRYRKHRVNRTSILLQQIETLERIWRMKSY